ncbi:MAG: hypothetical protein AAF679_06695 [Pseudomonadota bacterium]
MAKIAELEARLDAALAKIRQAPSGPASDGDLAAQNAELSASLDKLRAERSRDVAELDDLLAKLKPLIEEGR